MRIKFECHSGKPLPPRWGWCPLCGLVGRVSEVIFAWISAWTPLHLGTRAVARDLGDSQLEVLNWGGTTQGSTGSGGGAVGPPGLAPCQTSGGTPDRTFGQRGLGIGWLRIWRFSLAVARP